MKFFKLFSVGLLLSLLCLPLSMKALPTSPTPPTLIVKPQVQTSNGYSIVRLMWTFTDASNAQSFPGVRAVSTDILRDGTPLVSNVPWSVYIDTPVSAGEHSYVIKMNFLYTYVDEATGLETSLPFSAVSDPVSINVTARNPANIKYEIKEVYNLRIGEANKANSSDGTSFIPTQTGKETTIPKFDQVDFVRGSYHITGSQKNGGKGYWFFYDNGYGAWSNKAEIIAQQADRVPYATMYKVEDTPEALADPTKYQKLYTISNEVSWSSTTKPVPNYGPMNYFAVDQWENVFSRFGDKTAKSSLVNGCYYTRPAGEPSGVEYMLFPPSKFAVMHNSATGADPNPLKAGSLKIRELSKNMIANGGISASKASGKDVTFAYVTGPDTIWINSSNHSLGYTEIKQRNNQIGRCDMISFRGFGNKTFDTGKTEVLMSPGYTPFIYRLKTENGANVGESWFRLPDSESAGTENFSFFVDGEGNENRYIHQVRSGQYELLTLDPSKADATGDLTAFVNGEVINYLSTAGQINQAGGATLYFNGKSVYNDITCNDLFIVTPMGFGSVASGSFQVNLATKPNATATADQFSLTDLAPVGVFAQREESYASDGSNANNVALFMTKEQVGTSASGEPLYKIFIYQYVPTFRVAKYEIIPIYEKSATPIEIKIEKKYERDSEGAVTDIIGFNNEMVFNKPNYEGEDLEIKGYSIILTDPLGNKYNYRIGATTKDYDSDGVANEYFCEIRKIDANGNVTNEKVQKYDDKGFPLYEADGVTPLYYDDYIVLPEGASLSKDEFDKYFVNNFDIPFPLTSLGTYIANISVYVGAKGDTSDFQKGAERQSTIDINIETRDPDPWASAYRYDPEQDHNNGSIMASDPSHPYRIDGAFTMPEGSDPVSYYEVYIDGVKQTGYWVVENGIPTFCTSNKGSGKTEYNRPSSDIIPGDYDFDNDPNPNSPVAWKGNELTGEYEYGDGMANTIFSVYLPVPPEAINGDGSIDWTKADGIVGGYKICVKPVYAAETNFKMETNGCTETGLPSTTAVDEISAGAVTVYPIPAESEVSIAAPFAIEEVKFFSVSGALVKTVKFAGSENEVSVDVQNLAQGFYYININGKVSQKFIKR